MTQGKANKGAKFATMPAKVQENGSTKPFEVEIPKGVRDLIMAERKAANQDIEAYVRRRNEDVDRMSNYILRGMLATIPNVPLGLQLKPTDDYTKLVETA